MIATPSSFGRAAAAQLPVRGAHIHMIGVCGTGMTPLALALRSAGWRVSGEDGHWPAETQRWLVEGGVECVADGVLPAGACLVVHSSAVRSDQPTRAAAAERNIPAIRRGEALAALVRGRMLIAIAGSHGKTTTTAMLAACLRTAGIRADYLLGGLFADGMTPPATWRGEGAVVAEIDESDGTIEGFAPDVLLCVNVDWDHCDLYRDSGDVESAFAALAHRTRSAVFFNAACEKSRRIFSGLARKDAREVSSFGRGGDYALLNAFDDGDRGQTLQLGGRFANASAQLRALGEFNAVNAVGALAVATWLGAADVGRLLATFPGVRRRQAMLHSRPGVTVIEDYAHHPAEIEALLRSMRARSQARTVVVFQPHRFSRTFQFKNAFARALAPADRLFLLDVYPAGEAPIAGGASTDVIGELAALEDAPEVELLADRALAAGRIAGETRDNDLLLFIGAGDIDEIARETAARLREAPVAPAVVRDELLRSLAGRLSPETIVRAWEPLGPKTTMRVGGAAELYAEPASSADLQTLVGAARDAGMRVHLLGRGSNLIVPDEGVRGLVVRLQHPHWRRFLRLGPGRYWAGAGLRLKELCGAACRTGEGGFEFLEGIPGTVGGALRMNAGAMGGWMFDLVEEVHFLPATGGLKICRREELHVGYRHCAELGGAIALGAVIRAQGPEESAAIRARIEAYQQQRRVSQPREPSAGCIFKNPPGDFAGRIIDQLGLKGMRIGDAEVSPVHGNFIINRGKATGSDVIALVRRVREAVREHRHVELEPEVLLYGRVWEDVL